MMVNEMKTAALRVRQGRQDRGGQGHAVKASWFVGHENKRDTARGRWAIMSNGIVEDRFRSKAQARRWINRMRFEWGEKARLVRWSRRWLCART
jgi:hypothetical protein